MSTSPKELFAILSVFRRECFDSMRVYIEAAVSDREFVLEMSRYLSSKQISIIKGIIIEINSSPMWKFPDRSHICSVFQWEYLFIKYAVAS